MWILLLLLQTVWSDSGEGEIAIDGLFPVSDGDDINYQSGFLMAEAMRFAIEQINNDTSFLHGYKLGIGSIYDVQSSTDVRRRILDTFIAKTPFTIGPHSSQTSYIAGLLTSTFSQPTFSYGARYLNFGKDADHEYILRTVPSNLFQIHALLNVLKELQWNYLSVVASYSFDGETDAAVFVKKLVEIGVCLATKIDLPQFTEKWHFDDAITTLDSLSEGEQKHGVVLFTNNIDSRHFFAAVQRNGKKGRFIAICISGCTHYVENVRGLENATEGTLSIGLRPRQVEGFKDFVLSQRPNANSFGYFNRTWEKMFGCSLAEGTCNDIETFHLETLYRPYHPVHLVTEAVYSIANGLQIYIGYTCRKNNKDMANETCFIDGSRREHYELEVFEIVAEYLSYKDRTIEDITGTVSYDIRQFRKVSNNSYEPVAVGGWQLQRPILNMSAEEVLAASNASFWLYNEQLGNGSMLAKAICSRPCMPGYIAVPKKKNKDCCWECRQCGKNSVSRNNSCIDCKHSETVVDNKCQALPVQRSKLWVVFTALVVICLLMHAAVVVVFVAHNNSKVVKSTGRDLSYTMLLGLALVFISPLAYTVQPSTAVCVVRSAMPGLAFLICYASLFLRTWRIHRIFVQAKATVRSPSLISARSQLLIVACIIGVQALLAAVWFSSKLPVAQSRIHNNMVVKRCSQEGSVLEMFVNLALSIFFVVCCTILAFKTRHFPKNYNEAKFIGVTLYVTCIAWALFLPTFYLSKGGKEYLVCAMCICTGLVTLFGIFAHKIRLLFVKDSSEGKETLSSSEETTAA